VRHEFRDIVYDSHSLSVVEAVIVEIMRGLDSDNNISWLDVGCGVGKASEIALKHNMTYVGVDSSKKNIQYCKKNFGFEFLCGDFATLSIPGKFHVITFISTLHHFSDWRQALQKGLSLLDENGVVYIEHEPTRFFSRLYKIWMRLKGHSIPELKEIEIHWLNKPSILPKDLHQCKIEYHFDFIPLVKHLHVRTSNALIGGIFPHYRAIILKPKIT
jgi:SAM-dependent methyltransferase